MSLALNYTYKELEQIFGADLLAKATANLHNIENLVSDGKKVEASVRESSQITYRVRVEPVYDKGRVSGFESLCPCLQAKPCIHSATLTLLSLTGLLSNNPPKAGPAPELLNWVQAFRELANQPASTQTAPSREVVYYRFVPVRSQAAWLLQLLKCTIRKQGTPNVWQPWTFSERTFLKPPRYLQDDDLAILRILHNHYRYLDSRVESASGYEINAEWGSEVVKRVLATGRMVIRDAAGPGPLAFTALTPGDNRTGSIDWQRNGEGQIVPVISTGQAGDVIIPVEPPWYLDQVHRQAGYIDIPLKGKLLAKLMDIPPLREADLSPVANLLTEVVPEIPPPAHIEVRVVDVPLKPVLSLGTLTDLFMTGWQSYRYGETCFDYATLSYRYDDVEIGPDSTERFFQRPNGEATRVMRKTSQEKACIKQLKELGFISTSPQSLYPYPKNTHLPSTVFGLDREAAWPEFLRRDVPALQEAGWEVWIPPDFRHRYLEVEAFEADLHEAEGWFDLDLGVIVEGRRVALAPLIHELFRRDGRWLNQDRIDQISDDESIILIMAEGERLMVPAQRLKPLARMLIDLFDAAPSDSLRFSRFDAPRLADLAEMSRWTFKGLEAITDLAKRLQQTRGIHAITPPRGFALQLRPYQLDGLAWLQFLREQNLSGILADDMGLGKTAQALSHLLLEKESGRMNQPSLIVMPTSLIYNWRREAQKFAPDLKVLSLQGGDRKENFAAIPDHDVVLTTYPLLWRDEEQLGTHEYHLLILDEAQTVKNASSQAAQVVRKLKARHRLCLTGTPLENHLGELWAQFDFLLPGFLRDSKSFNSTWRTPIEKHGDKLRRNLLARRVKPFILRRRKEEVAKELPEKTIIVRTVELEGGQRDLYEAVRTAMNEKVQQAIASQGFARSQIIILDALLKLRQVCCDPRLLKLPSAGRVKERAKLDMLMNMVPELVNEGRRILIFSQFTSMLALIEAELKKHKLGYVQLTGETRDRETVIGRFQAGEVPLFLISLKAGGVGLNLTAADTVIHYDPWWNPAVENQATDRAHRIGQTRQVFVYKLVVAGSIEEKILVLQDRKAELAAGVLSEDTEALSKFGEADISALLEPLPVQ